MPTDETVIAAFFVIIHTMITLLIQVFENLLFPPGLWSSGGREQSQTTLWWARGWERPSPPTSKWQRATITAGTLEERQWIGLREWSQTDRVQSDTVWSHLQFGPASGRGPLHAPNLVYVDSPGVAGGLRHYNVWSCDILNVSKKAGFCVLSGTQGRCELKTECQWDICSQKLNVSLNL